LNFVLSTGFLAFVVWDVWILDRTIQATKASFLVAYMPYVERKDRHMVWGPYLPLITFEPSCEVSRHFEYDRVTWRPPHIYISFLLSLVHYINLLIFFQQLSLIPSHL
jgi:hypothetical protein